MKLIQVRVRGLAPLSASRWFDLGAGLNLFQLSDLDEGGSQNFFQTLQTISPSYDCQAKNPFAELQNKAKAVKQGNYTRHISPHKRTVAMAVYSVTPPLVQELASLNQNLYETDRIEVGRRLDYSRWINFVELASSTRWSEISVELDQLYTLAHDLEPELPPPIRHPQLLKPTDRITGDLQDDLASWLQNLPSTVKQSSSEQIANTLTAVMRASHFHTAKQIVRRRLPLFILFDCRALTSSNLPKLLKSFFMDLLKLERKVHSEALVQKINQKLARLQLPESPLHLTIDPKSLSIETGSPSSLPATPIDFMQAKSILSIAFSEITKRAKPIFLFSRVHEMVDPSLHNQLSTFVQDLSSNYQCLYSFKKTHIFSDGNRSPEHLKNWHYLDV